MAEKIIMIWINNQNQSIGQILFIVVNNGGWAKQMSGPHSLSSLVLSEG
jgi:hypothetical protein